MIASIINSSLLIPMQINKFKKQHPDTEVLIAVSTKARRVKSNDEANAEIGWATARRSILILTTDALYCGDWTILISNIQEATLLQIAGGSLLKVSTKDGLHYQFGLQCNPAWQEQKVLPLNVEVGTLKISKAGIVLRLVLLAWIVYFIRQDYLQNGLSNSVIIALGLLVWISYSLLRYFRFSNSH